jgi:hypothetical protein
MEKRGHRPPPLTRPSADLSPRGEVENTVSSRTIRAAYRPRSFWGEVGRRPGEGAGATAFGKLSHRKAAVSTTTWDRISTVRAVFAKW